MSSPAQPESESPLAQPIPVWKLVMVATMAAGIHLASAVQISWLTPAYEVLGVPDRWTSLIWLGSAVSSSVLHPILSYYSNRCICKLGCRHPFILAAAVAITIALLTIGFAADNSYVFGDNLSEKTQPCAVAIFGIGFWMLDTSINMIEAPCKAFLDDLVASDQRKIRLAYTFFGWF